MGEVGEVEARLGLESSAEPSAFVLTLMLTLGGSLVLMVSLSSFMLIYSVLMMVVVSSSSAEGVQLTGL